MSGGNLATSVVRELGWTIGPVDDGLRLVATVVPGMCFPGTSIVRTSVLAVWADVAMGLLSSATIEPRIAVTLDLDLQVVQHPIAAREIVATATLVKAGRSIVITAVELRCDGEAEPFALALGSFMASPLPEHRAPEGGFPLGATEPDPLLTVPLAERAQVRRTEPGRAEIPWHLDNVNATGAVQGGLIALTAEEAALSIASGQLPVSLSLRYLRAVRSGVALATARRLGDLLSVDVVDRERGAPAATATMRLTVSPPHAPGPA